MLGLLKDKREKIEAYRSAGIIKEDDACLIALAQAGIVDNDTCDEEVPGVVRAVFGIGEIVLHVPIYSDEPTRVEIPPRDEVSKANGKPVSTRGFRGFLDGHANEIAGILFASDWVWNLDWEASKSLRLVHNPTARVPLKRHSILTHCEMWAEDGWLQHRGRFASFGPYA